MATWPPATAPTRAWPSWQLARGGFWGQVRSFFEGQQDEGGGGQGLGSQAGRFQGTHMGGGRRGGGRV